MDRHQREKRIREALDLFGLADRADDLVKHYSGGMMRRLEIAQAIVNRPRLLFLDEPSIGLDPYSRMKVIAHIRELNEAFGTTILLTTHDMAEADELCDRLAIMDRGKIAAMGSPRDLKRSVGGDVLTVTISGTIRPSLPPDLGELASSEGDTWKILTQDGEKAIPRVTEFVEMSGATVESVSLRRPTLDDVFMNYARGSLREDGGYGEARSSRRAITRHGK